MRVLLLDAKHAIEEARAAGADRLAADVLAALHDSYREVIALGYEEDPALRDQTAERPKRTKAQNLLLRLDKREDQALRCAHDFRVAFDNNLSERDLRMIKLLCRRRHNSFNADLRVMPMCRCGVESRWYRPFRPS